jgi:hypothetical protein
MTCLLAVLALSAVVASSATAASPEWWIAGSPLKAKATAAVAETTNVTIPFSIKTSLVAWECGAIAVPNAFIEGEKTARLKAIVFKNCKVTGTSGCTVPSTEETHPLTATLEGTTKNYKLDFAPTTKKVLSEVTFSGTHCAVTDGEEERLLPVEGSMACNYPGVETESVDHLLEFTATSGSLLKLAGEEATFTGLDEFWLASKSKWSVK